MKWKVQLDKKSLRPIKHQQRKVFPLLLKETFEKQIQEKCLEFIGSHQIISTYISIKDEISTRLLINELLKLNKTVCCPVLIDGKMVMNQLDDIENTQEKQLNLLEPKTNLECEPSLVFVPMLAFNQEGYRIGYGKGYYDQYLQNRRALKVGLAYSWMLEEFEPSEFDVKLDVIVTEKEIFYFK